jgi:hypothetical protein
MLNQTKLTSFLIGFMFFSPILLILDQTKVIAQGFPQIIFDSREGPGQNLFTTQGLTYDAQGGFWAASAKATSITFDGINFIPLVNGTADLRGAFIDSSFDGTSVTGNFTTFGIPGLDVTIADETGLLLAGTYGKRIIRCDVAATQGFSEATLTVTGGSLASFFAQGQGMMVNNIFDILPICSEDTFSDNFNGQLDGVISSQIVPEPSSFLGILALGTISAASTLKRKLKQNKLKEKQTV